MGGPYFHMTPGAKNVTDIYIYTLAHIRPLHCTISSLALRRSATMAENSNKTLLFCHDDGQLFSEKARLSSS